MVAYPYYQSISTTETRYPNVEQFNVAVPGSECKDLPLQAVDLVNRIRSNATVDFENDWKLVTIFYGGNDACDYCDHGGVSESSPNSNEQSVYFHINNALFVAKLQSTANILVSGTRRVQHR